MITRVIVFPLVCSGNDFHSLWNESVDNSPDCVACANQNCRSYIDQCTGIEGNAKSGIAKGKRKSELCVDLLNCTIKGRCITEHSSVACYCGTTPALKCMSRGEKNGSCRAKFEGAFETDDGSTILVDWIKNVTGGGAAMGLVNCLMQNSCTMCF